MSVADAPPPAAVERVAVALLAHDGDLRAVYRAPVESPEAWRHTFAKYKTPSDFVFSSARALGYVPKRAVETVRAFETLGQRPYAPGSLAGWPDTQADWDAADALLRRVDWSIALGRRLGGSVDARSSAGECALPVQRSGPTWC